MHNPRHNTGSQAKLDALFASMLRAAGDDPHRPGVLEEIAAILTEALKDAEIRDEIRDRALENTDVYGSLEQPGLGLAGVRSAAIGYREPHDHGPCWAINLQLSGKLRLVHWQRVGADEATGKLALRRLDEVHLGPGDLDCSPPGIAHELFPETEDSVEVAVRCHSLASIIQTRYDRNTGEYKLWSWGKRETVGTGEFLVVGDQGQAAPPPAALTSRPR